MLYFISCVSVVVHFLLPKQREKKSVATETKPPFLYKHQFATVHNLFARALHHSFYKSSHEWSLFLDTREEREGWSKARMSPSGFRLINSHRRRVGTTIITSRWMDRKNDVLSRSLSFKIISPSSFLVRAVTHFPRNIYKYFSQLRWLGAPLAFPCRNICILTGYFTFNIDRHSRSSNKISIFSIERKGARVAVRSQRYDRVSRQK